MAGVIPVLLLAVAVSGGILRQLNSSFGLKLSGSVIIAAAIGAEWFAVQGANQAQGLAAGSYGARLVRVAFIALLGLVAMELIGKLWVGEELDRTRGGAGPSHP